MNLLDRILQCSEDELDSIIEKSLREIEESSEKGKILGFGENRFFVFVHKGFISFSSRIKYSGRGAESYSMKTDDYFYEFARFVRKMNIKNKSEFINFMEMFINQYFGLVQNGVDDRSKIFNDVAWNTTTTDDEYFAKLENNEIGDLKGKGVAMCTERAAMAQNLLSLFGFETYYCMGCVNNNGKDDAHCFNIVRAKEMFKLLDYSLAVPAFCDNKIIGYFPFQGDIELSMLDDILLNGVSKKFSSYYYIKIEEDNKYRAIIDGKVRTYVVGDFSLSQNKKK